MNSQHEKINYLELPALDLKATKQFFESVFGWKFRDFGSEYTCFDGSAGLHGGFYMSNLKSKTSTGGALIVFYSEQLDETKQKILDAGGSIVRPQFAFPGGQRFHFCDPNGNEYAVWSDK